MPYDVVLIDREEPPLPGERADQARERAVGSAFLENLPTSPKVLAFFYRGSTNTDELEARLHALGEKTGDNLFLNFGSLADPHYKTAARYFDIGSLPAIVVTAVSPLAATPDGHSAFVRLDSKALFANPAQLVQAVEAIFNRFLVGDISKAVRFGWQSEVRAALTQAAGGIWAVIQPVVDWISRKDLAIEFAEVKLEIKESGSRK